MKINLNSVKEKKFLKMTALAKLLKCHFLFNYSGLSIYSKDLTKFISE